ncbi:MAG: TlpA family protein disulfide reductase [Acidobacteriia bacterium]|nr:TlpA family protein disulfide reductase [Terriglobia bacterium]
MSTIDAGHTAPDFSLKTAEGCEFSLDKLCERGPVVAAFFKISCPVCQFTFPFLERLHRQYAGDGVVILGVSQNDARDTRKFCKEYGVTFPVVLDDAGYPVSNAYGISNVPTVYLIDSARSVKVSCMGFGKQDLETIAGALAERRKLPATPLFLPNEIIPAYKPG